MKKIFLAEICAVFLAAFFLSCATSAVQADSANFSAENPDAKNSADDSAEKISVKFFDNCPETTPALMAEVELAATADFYDGTTEILLGEKCTASQSAKIAEYVSFCTKIKSAMEKFTGRKFSVSFNSRTDGSGTSFDFSSQKKIEESVKEIFASQTAEIYAVYVSRDD